MRCPVSDSLAPYALGSLTSGERERVAEHLAACAECRRELAEMAGVVGLLHRLSPGDVITEANPAAEPVRPDPPVTTPRWRRPRSLVIAAAVVAVVVVGTGLAAGLLRNGGTATRDIPAAVAWSGLDAASGVAATARLRPEHWGTAVQLRVTNLPPGLTCRLVVSTADGGRQTIGTWRSGYVGSVSVPATTAVSPADIATLDVVTTSGQRLIRLAPGSRPAPTTYERDFT